MNSGFVPALGTPLDEKGNLLVKSYQAQIKRQLEAGASAMLVMGSMGQQASIKPSECIKVAKAAIEAVAGRVPIFVGAMDNSIAKVKERVAEMENLDIEGFVFTTPYYFASSPDQVINFVKAIAKSTKHSILLYDLPGVTQTKITYDMVIKMMQEIPNLIGIKSADLQMLRKLKLNKAISDDFIIMYSGLDTFDVAYKWGIDINLDGMIDCTPANFHKMYKALAIGDYKTAAVCLDNAVTLRDFFLKKDLWPAFSAAMNLLGFEGNFAPDYVTPASAATIEEIRVELQRIGEL